MYEYIMTDKIISAHTFIQKYLRQNIVDATTIHQMQQFIREFLERSPRLIVTKCIDGRVHGSKPKGYPPTAATFARTDGNKVDLTEGNFSFWNRIDRVVSDARWNTHGMPALFIAYMHYSSSGLGCAAHQKDDSKALEAVLLQARVVQTKYDGRPLYALVGKTDTDTMAETLVFLNGTELSAAQIIKTYNLHYSSDIFTSAFLDSALGDVSIARAVGNRTVRQLLEGESPLLYTNLGIAIAMESHLLREISQRESEKTLDTVVHADVLRHISSVLDAVSDLPSSLRGPLFYQTIWNIAYSLYQSGRLTRMSQDEAKKEMDHAEDLICYGEGFELLYRNTCLLVKPGRGNDADALTIAKAVLAHHAKDNSHHPIVHVNVEVSGRKETWEAFNEGVGSKLLTMYDTVRQVFGKDVHVLTTYSYLSEKCFYPVHWWVGDQIMSYPTNILTNLQTRASFNPHIHHAQETAYVQQMLTQ